MKIQVRGILENYKQCLMDDTVGVQMPTEMQGVKLLFRRLRVRTRSLMEIRLRAIHGPF